jgi:hypothetical protein
MAACCISNGPARGPEPSRRALPTKKVGETKTKSESDNATTFCAHHSRPFLLFLKPKINVLGRYYGIVGTSHLSRK